MKKKNVDLARAWRDQDYFLSLTEEERAGLGAHPAGVVLQDDVLQSITGGCCDSTGFTCNTLACTNCGNCKIR